MDNRPASQPKSHKSHKHDVKQAASTHASEVVDSEEKRNMSNSKLKNDIQHGVAHPLNELEQHVNDLDDSWETESMLAEMLDGLTDDKIRDDPNFCTPDEAVSYRQQLRTLGPEEFCRRTIDAGVISAKKLLSAFGVRPPDFLEGQPDESYHSLLILALSRELSKRAKLSAYNSVDDVVELLKKSKNIIVLTGAGISTSLGIPDFRSAGTGLYSKLEHLGLNDPQEVFNIGVFKDDPSIFFSIARDILPETERFSPTHAFIALLQQKGKLLTNYSQNIDNLESKAGITPDKLIQCHGSFATASCIQCGHKVPGERIFPDIKEGKIPFCPKCAAPRRTTHNSRKRKLARDGTEKKKPRRRPGDYDSAGSDSEYSSDLPSRGGLMKPDITFFGEALPDEFSRRLVDVDRFRTDLVVVIGTSLKVAPVSELVPFLPSHVPQIYISRTPVAHHNFDVDLLGDCDVVVAELCRRAGWDLRHEMIPADQRIEVQREAGWPSRHVFTSHREGGDVGNEEEEEKSRKGNGNDDDADSAKGGVSGKNVVSPPIGLAARVKRHNDDDDDDDEFAPPPVVVTTTRSGRRSGRASPK